MTEDIKLAILETTVSIIPSLQKAMLLEHRGDLNGWGPAPNHIQPVLGQLPEWKNVYIAARMGALGVTFSLGVGQVMAELIISEGRVPHYLRNMIEVLSPARL